MSSPSLAFSVAFMSISVRTPNPSRARDSRVCWTASANEERRVVDSAMVIAGSSRYVPGYTCPRAHSRLGTLGPEIGLSRADGTPPAGKVAGLDRVRQLDRPIHQRFGSSD